MAAPPEIEQVLAQIRDVLLKWHDSKTIGEIVVIKGGNQYQVEEVPRRKHPPVKRLYDLRAGE